MRSWQKRVIAAAERRKRTGAADLLGDGGVEEVDGLAARLQQRHHCARRALLGLVHVHDHVAHHREHHRVQLPHVKHESVNAFQEKEQNHSNTSTSHVCRQQHVGGADLEASGLGGEAGLEVGRGAGVSGHALRGGRHRRVVAAGLVGGRAAAAAATAAAAAG